MTPSRRRRAMTVEGAGNEITLRGHLDDHWSDRLGGFAIALRHDGTSVLTATSPTRPACTA